jgi:hypothetical protein
MRRNAAEGDKKFLGINPRCNNTLAEFVLDADRVFVVFLKKGLAREAVRTYNFVPLLQRRKRSNGGGLEAVKVGNKVSDDYQNEPVLDSN